VRSSVLGVSDLHATEDGYYSKAETSSKHNFVVLRADGNSPTKKM
jgi:hypothetical protein